LESSLNFLSNDIKKYYKINYSQGEKWCKNLNCQKDSFQRQSGSSSPLNPTWSTKISVLSTFLESSLNFLSNDIKNITKSSTVREKSIIKFETAKMTVIKESQGENRLSNQLGVQK